MSEPVLKPLTFEDVSALEDHHGIRYELWDGEPVAMTGGTPAHNLIALGLRDTIKSQLSSECRVFVADVGLRLGESMHSEKAYPDVMLVCNPRSETYQTDPVLIAEVLSDNSVGRDRNKKLRAYTTLPSVQTYLILSQTAIEIEVYRRSNNWAEEVHRGGSAVVELTKPPLQLPLREIYSEVWSELAGNN